MHILEVKNYLETLQQKLIASAQVFEVKPFIVDSWQRAQGGGGITAVLQQGNVFESIGINFSHVFGDAMPASATSHRPELAGRAFEAMGVSVITHPLNPYIPTSHMNVRFFVASKPGEVPIWWFGGGFDLTPFYPFHEDVIFWHQAAKTTCDHFDNKIYRHYKDWADRYFFLPHRQETRGVGGLFFDDLTPASWGWDFEKCFAFLKAVGTTYWQTYGPLVQRHYQSPYGEREKAFQRYRRGRYVEFNLLYDRGTLFGLHSGGRTESILVSMPPSLSFEYQWTPTPGSQEALLGEKYLTATDWLSQA